MTGLLGDRVALLFVSVARAFFLVCGGALLLVIRLAFFLIHSSALLLVFSGALPVIVLSADTLMAYRALLYIHSDTHLFHLRLAVFILHCAALLLIRCVALVLMGGHCFVLGVAVPLPLLGHVPSINSERQQHDGQTTKDRHQVKIGVSHFVQLKADKQLLPLPLL